MSSERSQVFDESLPFTFFPNSELGSELLTEHILAFLLLLLTHYEKEGIFPNLALQTIYLTP
jgi:hypothetical protein